MDQYRFQGMTDKDRRELLLGLFREWWLAATQALVDQLGSSKALQLLAPGFRHHGHAGYKILTKSMGWDESELSSIAAFEYYAKTMMSGAPAEVELLEDGVIWMIEGCKTHGICKEACLCYCHNAGRGMLEEFSQSMEYSLRESLSQGDSRCLASIERKGHGTPSGRVLRSITPENLSIDDQQWDFWCRAGMGEVWAITTRAVIEGLGSKEAMLALHPHVEKSGVSVGNLIKRDNVGEDAVDAVKAIVLMQSCFGMEGRGENGATLGEIFSCPFSGGSIEMCLQFETFMSGLCSVLDPSSKFAYDRMMTRGDETCHWTLRRKEPEAVRNMTAENSQVDPMTRLTNKFIDGEITEDEYERKMKVIKKHYPR